MVAKTPRLLTAEQRDAFVRVPADLSERDLGRFYTLSARDLEIIGRHRRPANRLGFAVHLGLPRFPGRTFADVPEIPERVVEYIAQQVDVDPAVFEQYGGFLSHFTHLVSAEVPEGERRQMLIAAIMGLGMNHGLGRLARSTPFSYRQLAWAADWHIREDTLRRH